MKRIIFLYLTMITTTGLFAQTLSLEQARVLALANSRSLAKYELALRSSILDERSQLYSMLPSVSAEYSASMNYFYDWEFVNPVDTFRAGAAISITQIIFQGGKSFIQKAISAIATESVRIDALAEYFNVLDSVDNAYYEVLEAAATLEAEEISLTVATLSHSIAEIRYTSGMITQGDYLRALADMEVRMNSRNQARRSLAQSMAKLRTLTGISQAVEFEQIDFDIYEDVLSRLAGISDEEADELFGEFRRIIATSNPSFAKASLNNQRAEKNFSLTQRDYAPTIRASIFGAGLNYSAANNSFSTTSSGGVSITGSIPVDFWVMNNRMERSRIAYESAAIDYTNAELSLETELQTALLNTFAQAGSVLSFRRSLEYTERHFEFVMERYRLSQSSVSDLHEASNLLVNSRNSHIRSKYGFLRSLARLRSLCALDDEEKLLGLLLGDFL